MVMIQGSVDKCNPHSLGFGGDTAEIRPRLLLGSSLNWGPLWEPFKGRPLMVEYPQETLI